MEYSAMERLRLFFRKEGVSQVVCIDETIGNATVSFLHYLFSTCEKHPLSRLGSVWGPGKGFICSSAW